MKTSANGIRFITEHEGFATKAYKDGFINNVQKYSIGYGHQIQLHERNLLTKTITKTEGKKLLEQDLKNVENVINQNSKTVLSQSQFDALVSFGYNTGVGALAKVLVTYNTTKSVQDTVSHIKQYRGQNTPTGFKVLPVLVQRRSEEAELFQKKKSFSSSPYYPFGVFSWAFYNS